MCLSHFESNYSKAQVAQAEKNLSQSQVLIIIEKIIAKSIQIKLLATKSINYLMLLRLTIIIPYCYCGSLDILVSCDSITGSFRDVYALRYIMVHCII